MIPQKLHLFWCGPTMSYLRYMTFVTARHFNPKWEINLYISPSFTDARWTQEDQDFHHKFDDYGDKVKQLVDNVFVYDKHIDIAPNFQSDFFRWDILNEHGGFYLDTDQIILRPFDDLLQYEFIYALYRDNGPVGVLGAIKHSPITQHISNTLSQLYNPKHYNCIGPQMFIRVMRTVGDNQWFKAIKSLNSRQMFYPIAYSYDVDRIYDGRFVVPSESYALHWFGGHPLSQTFNAKFTPEFAKTSDDTISQLLRQHAII